MTSSSRPGHVIAITALGVDVDISVGGSRADELREHLLRAWAWCGAVEGESRSGPTVLAFLDDDAVAIVAAEASGVVAGDDLLAVSEAVTAAVTLRAIEASAGELLVMRAAAVAHPVTGRSVILVGAPGSGKSTVAHALTRYFAYVTDDTLALTRSLEVLPYPKPMSVHVDDVRATKKQFSPAELDIQRPPATLRPAAVFLLDRRDEGFVPPGLTELPMEESIARIAEQCSFLGALDKPLHRIAELLHLVGPVHQVTYREADDLVALTQSVLNVISEPTTHHAEDHEPSLVALGMDTRAHGSHGLVWRRDFTDLYVQDGIGCVMVDDHVVGLSIMATRILTLLGDAKATIAQLTEALVAEFGSPDAGGATALIEKHIDDLVAVGVLART